MVPGSAVRQTAVLCLLLGCLKFGCLCLLWSDIWQIVDCQDPLEMFIVFYLVLFLDVCTFAGIYT